MKESILKYSILFLTILFSFTIQSGCSRSNNNNNSNTLQSISITPANSIMHLATTQQLIATGIYKNGTTKNITTLVIWRSSNTNAASVSNSPYARI